MTIMIDPIEIIQQEIHTIRARLGLLESYINKKEEPNQPKNEIDEWLYEGCLCEFWNREDKSDMMYSKFIKSFTTGLKYLYKCENNRGLTMFESFKNCIPIIPPLQVAPEWAKYIMFGKDGGFRFYHDETGPLALGIGEASSHGVWPDCPEEWKGTTKKIPEFARR